MNLLPPKGVIQDLFGVGRSPFRVRSGSVWGSFRIRSGAVRDPFGVRSGFVWGPFGLRSGSVRDPFGICSRSVRDPFGGRSGSVRGLFGVRLGSVRGPFGVRSESVRGPKRKTPMYYCSQSSARSRRLSCLSSSLRGEWLDAAQGACAFSSVSGESPEKIIDFQHLIVLKKSC